MQLRHPQLKRHHAEPVEHRKRLRVHEHHHRLSRRSVSDFGHCNRSERDQLPAPVGQVQCGLWCDSGQLGVRSRRRSVIQQAQLVTPPLPPAPLPANGSGGTHRRDDHCSGGRDHGPSLHQAHQAATTNQVVLPVTVLATRAIVISPTGGGTGTVVTVSGSNFNPATSAHAYAAYANPNGFCLLNDPNGNNVGFPASPARPTSRTTALTRPVTPSSART